MAFLICIYIATNGKRPHFIAMSAGLSRMVWLAKTVRCGALLHTVPKMMAKKFG